MIKRILLSIVLLSAAAFGQKLEEDIAYIMDVFRDAEKLCERAGDEVWGTPLYGPIMVVEPSTRFVIANVADPAGKLEYRSGVYTGTLPEDLPIANTAVDWEGKKWTMLIYPLPEKLEERNILVAHELFHRIQDELGFPASNPSNAHLDTEDGRIWLRAEMRALVSALSHSGVHMFSDLTLAIQFRMMRYAETNRETAIPQERQLEMNEGLAEFTGIMTAAKNKRAAAIRSIKQVEASSSFVRNFAYATGAGYGVLLSEQDPDWNLAISKDDNLHDIVMKAYNLTLPVNQRQVAETNIGTFGANIKPEEAERAKERAERNAYYEKKFVKSPVLILPMRNPSVSFDPNNLMPLGEFGTIYPDLRLVDEWGTMQADTCALVSRGWTTTRISPPTETGESSCSGDGWTLNLNEGWEIVRNNNGNYELKQIKKE